MRTATAIAIVTIAVFGATGCAESSLNFVQSSAYPGTRTVEGAPPAATEERPEASDPRTREILVTPQKDLGRACEVIGVLDFHSSAESEDKGFDEMRVRAAAMGADAVIGAEFEHGEPGAMSHLSGMVVRYR